MLTRPGAGPGCSWMKRWSEHFQLLAEKASEKGAGRAMPKWFWWLWLAFFVVVFLILPLQRGPYVAPAPSKSYESSVHLAGLPLLVYGPEARGIVAVGGKATGVVAIGGVAVGLIAFGGVALGGISLGGLSVGILALGGGALGWWAVGGGAAGYYAFGGLAMGGYAYAGNGVALGYYEASGRQKEQLLG